MTSVGVAQTSRKAGFSWPPAPKPTGMLVAFSSTLQETNEDSEELASDCEAMYCE